MAAAVVGFVLCWCLLGAAFVADYISDRMERKDT